MFNPARWRISVYGSAIVGLLVTGEDRQTGIYKDNNCALCHEALFQSPTSFSLGALVQYEFNDWLGLEVRPELNYRWQAVVASPEASPALRPIAHVGLFIEI